MALIPNFRTRKRPFETKENLPNDARPRRKVLETRENDTTVESSPQAMVDTPQHRLTDWFKACEAPTEPLGKFREGFRVGIVGGGGAGVLAAYLAAKAGATVTLIEMLPDVGGRARSVDLGGKNVGEEGCMRFPPSESLLYLLAENFGYGFIEKFPNPGVVPTLVSYGGECQLWNDNENPPKGFETVAAGWGALVDDGCIINGKKFESRKKMAEWLQSPEKSVRMQVQKAWQDYIDEFKDDTFLQGMQKIFGKSNETPPGGNNWYVDEFSRFGKLGFGSGGFGAFYSSCFLTVWRSFPNQWDTDQSTFAKLDKVDGKFKPAGIRELWKSICKKAEDDLGLKCLLNTKATAVSKSACGSGGNPIYTVTVESKTDDKGTCTDVLEFDDVFINVTTKVAQNLNLSRKGPGQIFPDNTCDAINEIHMASCSKLFITVPRSPFDDKKFPRVLLTDGDLPQLYTLDYGDKHNIVILVVYAWEGYSELLQADRTPERLFEDLKALAAKAVANNKEYPKWADCLDPLEKKFVVKHWQEDPAALGAFTFALPGQERLCAALFYDFEKGEGPYFIGDSASFGGGWVEPGLETAVTCFSAMLKKHGKLYHSELAPVNLLSSSTYKY